MNEVFKEVGQRINEFNADYNKRMDAERERLAKYEAVAPAAFAKADEAIKANDMKAWKAADKEKREAEEAIRFTKARIEALEKDNAISLDEYETLRLKLRCEYARLRMEFFKLLQNRYEELLAAAEQLDIEERDFENIMRDLSRIGGDSEDGYDRYIPSTVFWRVGLEKGRLFNGIDKINVETAEGRSNSNWVHGLVFANVNVLNEGRKAGVINE